PCPGGGCPLLAAASVYNRCRIPALFRGDPRACPAQPGVRGDAADGGEKRNCAEERTRKRTHKNGTWKSRMSESRQRQGRTMAGRRACLQPFSESASARAGAVFLF